MKIYLKTKKTKVFIIAIFLAFFSFAIFYFHAFASDSELEHIPRFSDTSIPDSITAIRGETIFFNNGINGPAWEGTDEGDVVRLFTFFDKTKVELDHLNIYTGSGGNFTSTTNRTPDTHFTDDTNSPIYASEALRFGSSSNRDTRGALTHGDTTDYGGIPMWYFHTLDITTEPATGKRNPCKLVYEYIIDTQSTTDFPNLKNNDPASGGIAKDNIGCVGFERFRGEIGGTLGNLYPNNTFNGFTSTFKGKAAASYGETNLISVAHTNGYVLSGTSTTPPIKEKTVVLNIIPEIVKTETFEIQNPPAEGVVKSAFVVKVGFAVDVTGFVEDADFRFVRTGTSTEVGEITNIQEAYADFTTDAGDPFQNDSSNDGFLLLNGRYYLVHVTPDVGLETTSTDTFQFEIISNTGIKTTGSEENGFVESTVGTYQLDVNVSSSFVFRNLEIPDVTIYNNFSHKTFNPGAFSAKREYFSRSEDIGVEFYATSNNGGGDPLPGDFNLKEADSFDPTDPPTDCKDPNKAATFSDITEFALFADKYSMTITLPTGKYNCLLSYTQTIDGTLIEKTLPIVYTGSQYFVTDMKLNIGPKVFDTFYINAETPPPVSFGPDPTNEVQTNSREYTITSESPSNGFNYFNIGLNLDVYNQLIDSSTDCDENLNWASNTKSDNTFITNNESQNGRFICVRNYDDFVTATFVTETVYSYETLEVENIDATNPTITSAALETAGTKTGNFEVNVAFSEEMANVSIDDFTFIQTENTTSVGTISEVQMHSDSNFDDSNPANTTDSTTVLSGQYFKIFVEPEDDIETVSGSATYEFHINEDISDVAGNKVGASATNRKLSVDINTQANPTVSAELVDTGILGKDFVVNVSFSEEVVNVDAADFDFLEASGGTSAGSITSISAFEDSDFTTADTTPDTSRYYQVSVTAIDGLVSITDGYNFRVLHDSADAIADKVGNLLDTGGSTDDVRLNFLISNIDTTKPTATIAAITDTKNAAFTVQVSFSETVNNVGLADFELTDGTDQKGSISSVFAYDSTFTTAGSSTANLATNISGQYFLVSVTPDSLLEGSYRFKILATTTDTIVDDLSNTFVEEAVNSQIQIDIDTTDPTATIGAVTGTQNAEFTVKVSFSESVNNVDISDFRFVLENTSTNLSSITKVEAHSDSNFNDPSPTTTTTATTISGQYFVVSLEPSDGIETSSTTTYSFEVFPDSANTITDTAGNTLSAPISANISVDTKKPTATVDVSGEQEKTFAVNVTFSEEVENVNIDDFTFIQTGTTNSAGTITGVEKHSDSNFNDQSPSTTTQTGQYFKVLVEAINDIATDSATTFTFNVIANTDQTSLIKDTSENTFQIDLNSSTLVDIDTKEDPTVSSVSAPSGTQIDAFNVNITFSEPVSNVDIGDFEFIETDNTDPANPIMSSVGTITKVEAHSDSNFNDTSPSTTTDATTLSGTYFKVMVSPQDDLMTDDGVTDYAFQVINDTTNSIIDGASNTLGAQGFSGIIRSTTNINIDTVHPKTTEVSLTVAGTQETTFDVDVTFSESVNNVDISDFEFIEIDDTDPANTITSSVGTITKVEAHSDSNFNDTSPSTTTDATTLSGTYFKISIKPNEDIEGTYTFKVLSGSIVDDATNTFETSANDSLSVAVNTARKPTLTSVSDADPSTTLKTGDFEINVEFSEVVYGVNKSDFQFTDGSTSVGTITQVEAVNFDFDSKNPNVITTDDTTISGRYFIVSVDPDEGLLTESAVTYTFEVLSSESITDGVPNSFDGTGGETTTLDVAVDTLDPLIISSEIVNSTLVLTSSLTLGDASTSSLTGDKSGGFTVTGSDSTVYTVSSVVVSGTTITITLTSPTGTDPTVRGTYSYRKNSTLNINTSSNNALADTTNPTAYGVVFDLDLDLSGDFIVAEDALFLYLYKQKENPFTKDALERYLNISSTYDNTIANIDAAILDNSLDLDLSGDFIVAEDALFLYLYKQKENPFTKDALERYLNISSTYDNTIANIDALITAVNQ